LNDNARVFGKGDVAASFDPAIVEGQSGTVRTEACGYIGGASGGSDDEADDTDAVGRTRIFPKEFSIAITTILVKRTGSERDEEQGNEDLVLRPGLYLAFGVHGEVLTCG